MERALLQVERLEVRAVPAASAPDFNGDGIADLAVGVPDEDVNNVSNAGAVQVFYGSSNGLGTDDQFFAQDGTGVPGVGDTDDRFGLALAWGDFNGDGFDDLAIGAPGDDDTDGDGDDDVSNAGSVVVLYGSSSGLTTNGSQYFSQDTAGLRGAAAIGNAFGSTLAAGDFEGDGEDDLAIGIPFTDDVDGDGDGEISDAGAVLVLRGSMPGLTTVSLYLSQETSGIKGVAAAEDEFGTALVVADFTGDGQDDLAIGVPNEDDLDGNGTSDVSNAGAAHVLLGSSLGLTTLDFYFTQDAPGVKGVAGADDGFGTVLAAGDFTGDGQDDLAIAAPFDDDVDGDGNPDIADAGSVIVLLGSSQGVTTVDFYFSQDTPGIDGAAASDDRFGSALAAGDFTGDGQDDLAIAAPFDNDTDGNGSSDVADAGVVHILLGSTLGLTTVDQYFSQDTPGLAGAAVADDEFGTALTAGDYDNDGFADLVAGTPRDNDTDGDGDSDVTDAGVFQVLFGSASGVSSTAQYLSQDSAGIEDTAEDGDLFGRSLV